MNSISGIEQVLRTDSVISELEDIHAKELPECTRFVRAAFSAVIKSGVLRTQSKALCNRNVAGVSKDETSAEILKDGGAVYFKDGMYSEAAIAYSKSLREAPQDSEEARKLTSTLHSNRALCLLKLNSHSGTFLASGHWLCNKCQ